MTITSRTKSASGLEITVRDYAEPSADERVRFEHYASAALTSAGLRVTHAIVVPAPLACGLRLRAELESENGVDLVLLPEEFRVLTINVPSRGGYLDGRSELLSDAVGFVHEAVFSREWTPFVTNDEYAALAGVTALALPDAREGNPVLEELRTGAVSPEHYPALLAVEAALAAGAPVEWARRRLDHLPA